MNLKYLGWPYRKYIKTANNGVHTKRGDEQKWAVTSSNHEENQNQTQHKFDIKTSIILFIPEKFRLKIEIHFQCYEIWHSEQVKFVNHEYDIWNCGSWPEIESLGRFGLKIAPIFIKFGIENKLNRLIMNTLIGIDELDPKLRICKI